MGQGLTLRRFRQEFLNLLADLNLKTVMELSTGMVSVQQVEQNFS